MAYHLESLFKNFSGAKCSHRNGRNSVCLEQRKCGTVAVKSEAWEPVGLVAGLHVTVSEAEGGK